TVRQRSPYFVELIKRMQVLIPAVAVSNEAPPHANKQESISIPTSHPGPVTELKAGPVVPSRPQPAHPKPTPESKPKPKCGPALANPQVESPINEHCVSSAEKCVAKIESFREVMWIKVEKAKAEKMPNESAAKLANKVPKNSLDHTMMIRSCRIWLLFHEDFHQEQHESCTYESRTFARLQRVPCLYYFVVRHLSSREIPTAEAGIGVIMIGLDTVQPSHYASTPNSN
ncbi:hypothetical protein K503DRAFT_787057, partial [Rhizopogon vinicolor AM-OR11-026]